MARGRTETELQSLRIDRYGDSGGHGERPKVGCHRPLPDSVLIVGSGPIVIGQAAEFDYSGTQACLACRDAGARTILVNSNPATIQTDPHVADTVYIEPLTVESIGRIIERERPEGVIATVGGQTGLNLTVALAESGVLETYGVRILGTGLEAIRRGEDRALFAATLRAAGQPILPSVAVSSVPEAIEAAGVIGYPVMCRSAFALGGAGSGFAANVSELAAQVETGLRSSGSGQVLIEKSVRGWSEIEYEVVRDAEDNCLIVCNMENVDPMGVHTGDSIVVAPSQTMTDREYHALRAAAIAVVRALGVEGACNVQFALDRHSSQYYVIEVNPRLSRSSALASKATGYPIAKVATEIALGRNLPQIRNQITGTSAFFEPALDYVVVKIPRWPFDKFASLAPVIGTAMRSTGEVMAIGATFEEAMAKAIRSLDGEGATRWYGQPVGAGSGRDRPVSPNDTVSYQGNGRRGVLHTPVPPDGADTRRPEDPVPMERQSRRQPCREIEEASQETPLATPNAYRLPAVLDALREGMEPTRVADLSGIHPWFVDRLALVAVGETAGQTVGYRMVDTCAAEFEARTPYFYGSTHVGHNEAGHLPGPKAIILGSGPIRIGQGIEFDYATVHACHALGECGVRSVIVNNNPETVSTDYSTSDRLYFEPLDADAVLAVVDNEADGLLGVIPQFGGQTAINLVDALAERGVRILGTAPDSIDAAEDRARSSAILRREGIPAPRWVSIDRWEDLPGAVATVGFPALLRPSYVLSGRGMEIVRTPNEVERYLAAHVHQSLDKPLLVDHFLEGAVELDVDAVSDGEAIVSVVMEQIEECGVHSGDSCEVFPTQTIAPHVLETVERYTGELARAFGIVGLMNVQYAVHGDAVYVLEVNPRASRSVPFASKASGIPLTSLAIQVILGRKLRDLAVPVARTDLVSVKSVVFPFRVFPDLPPVAGPEMQSTGESMGIGPDFPTAYWKARLGGGWKGLPFGRPVYVSPGSESPGLRGALEAAGCRIVEGAPGSVEVGEVSLAIVLGRSQEEIGLLRRCVTVGTPAITTAGATRGLMRALSARPCGDVIAHAGGSALGVTDSRSQSFELEARDAVEVM